MPRDEPLFTRLGQIGDPAGRTTRDFDLNPGLILPRPPQLRAAGVLVPLYAGPRGVELILTKRSSALRHHPGQIAFPGGKVERFDTGPAAAALREAHEEIGLTPANVQVLGTLPPHETGTGYRMIPVLGRIMDDFAPIPEPGEVDEVFRIPFTYAADPANYRIEARPYNDTMVRYFVLPFGPYYIWGATARILRNLAEHISQS